MIYPKLSIIVPIYNTNKHLLTCLDNLQAQTLDSFEVLIIDDHSSDDLMPLLNQYLQDQRFKYKRLSMQKGPGGARNAGLEIAQGEYIGFCDSDDWVDLNYYEYSVNFMEKHQADIGMCTLVREADGYYREQLYKCKYDQFIKLTPDMAIKIMTYQFDSGIKVIPPCTNKIYRKKFLQSLDVHFEEHMFFQDVYFSFQTILRANMVICIPHVRYHHYRRAHSIIQSFEQKHIDDFCRLFTLIRDFLKAEGLYKRYCFNYYKLCEHFYNIIIRQIFEFVKYEEERKRYMLLSFKALKQIVKLEEYFEYASAEELRLHIQPHITDTTLY